MKKLNSLDTSPNNLIQNVRTDYIAITEYKLENCLLKYGKYMNIKTSWITPMSLFLSCLATLLTAKFDDKFGLNSATWQALFIVVTFISIIWFVVSIINLCMYWKKGDIDYLIAQIKGTQNS